MTLPMVPMVRVGSGSRIPPRAALAAGACLAFGLIAAIAGARARRARSQAERHVDSTRRAMLAKEVSRARAATNL